MACSKTIKGICCTISAVCMHLILGTAYTWGNINVYYVSYVRLYNPKFTLMDGFFMVPILQAVSTYLTAIGGYYEKKTGPIPFNIISILSTLCALVLLYYFTDYWVIMISMGLYGIPWGLGYFPMLKQCWRYFPERKGLLSGLVVSCIGISTFLSTSLADYMINPNGDQPVDNYFPREIAIKTRDFIFVLTIILTCLGIISCCLMFPYKEDDQPPGEPVQAITQEEEEIKPKGYVQKERVKEVLHTTQFYLLGIIANGITFFSSLASNTNRTFGSVCHIDETLLQTLSKVYALINALSRFAWGFLFDRVNMRVLYCIVIVNHMSCAFGYYFAGRNGIVFFVVNCLVATSFAGQAALFNPVMVHKFGIKNSVILLGLINIVVGTIGLISPFLCKFYVNEQNDFLVVYITGGSFVLSAFIAFLFLKSDSHVYTWRSQRENEEEEQRKTIAEALIKETSGVSEE